MPLLNLPVELLRIIVIYTIPEGIESASLSCKTLHKVTEEHLPEHNRFRRFRHVKWDRPSTAGASRPLSTSDNIETSSELLVKIVDNPVIARYVEVADFGYKLGDNRSERRELINDNRDRIMKFMHGCRVIRETEIDPIQLLNQARLDPNSNRPMHGITAFLLALLPNIRDLTIGHQFVITMGQTESQVANIRRILTWIMKNANDPSNLGGTGLANLEILRQSPGHNVSRPIRLDIHGPLLSLPKLKTLHTSLKLLCDSDAANSRPFQLDMLQRDYKMFGQSLETIHLQSCCVNFVELSTLLSQCPNLRKFCFRKWQKISGCRDEYDLGHLVQYIESITYKQLEELSLRIGYRYPEIVNGIPSFRKFRKLKKVELDMRYLDSPKTSVETMTPEKLPPEIPIPPEIARLLELTTPPEATILPLNKMFPDCIEEITLRPPSSYLYPPLSIHHARLLHSMFWGIGDCNRLPCLRKVTIIVEGRGEMYEAVARNALQRQAVASTNEIDGVSIEVIENLLK